MSKAGLGAFAEGLASGLQTAQTLHLRDKRETRDQEQHGQLKRIREIGIGRLEKEQPVLDKELQVRGAKADFDLSEQTFNTEMQAFEQETRRLLSKNKRGQATLQAGETEAAITNQPDELAVRREELNNKVLEAVKRQTANIWSVAKLGNVEMALDMYNNSMLVQPGQKAKGFKIEEVDVPGANGAPATKAKVLVIEGADGKMSKIPVQALEALEGQFGAKYEKVGNSIVRIGRDGKTTPVYQQDKFQHTPDGDIYSETTGDLKTPAAGGINGAGGSPRPGSGAAKRIDERVKMAIDKVIMPKYGGRFEGGMFFPDEANKDIALRATELAGEYVRGGMHPEAAGAKAVRDAEREEALRNTDPRNKDKPKPDGGYSGPRPWAR